MDMGLNRKLWLSLSPIVVSLAIALFILLWVLPPKLSGQPPEAQPQATFWEIAIATFATATAVSVGTGRIIRDYYVDRMQEKLDRMEGVIGKLGILRDRESLHMLKSKKKWVIGSKLDFDASRTTRILESLREDRLTKIAFLCIDTEKTNLEVKIQMLQTILQAKYKRDSKRMKDVAARIYVREVDRRLVQFPMDIYDPYLAGSAKVAAYFPHSDEFLGNTYDTGFLISDLPSSNRGATSYFIEKAEELWRRSQETAWSKFKRKEFGIQEDLSDISPVLSPEMGSERERVLKAYRKAALDLAAEETGLSLAKLEDSISRERNHHRKG